MSEPKEINIPVADPNDPYAVPAAMPSSADTNPRSFDPADFARPTRKQDDFRFTPVERLEEFLDVFEPSNATEVTVTMIDGTPVDPAVVAVREATVGQEPTGTVGLPTDRIEAVEWASATRAFVVELKSEPSQPVLVKVHGTGDALDALHLVVLAADRVHGDVVIEHDGEARLAEGVEIATGTDAHISVTSVQEWSATSKHVGGHRIHVGAESSVRHAVVTLGGAVVRLRLDQDFGGEHGDINMLGIYFVDPGEHIEHRTMVVHNQPDCKSRVVYKGALSGKGAHSTWVGNALIEPTAPGTDSYELNRNLVLTPGAIADSEPNLEIENGNIVGAGHASSVGRFDDEELFYLQSRGIPEATARKLVVRGFFGELVEEIGIDAIAGHLMQAIDRRLARGEDAAMTTVLEEK
ncbi:MAG: Fe-S cluster assembly protein SufD [Bifidobacterium sp.]|nr:Fe-S cluster assembly protein SufD [Bifidobacterium sp.]